MFSWVIVTMGKMFDFLYVLEIYPSVQIFMLLLALFLFGLLAKLIHGRK